MKETRAPNNDAGSYLDKNEIGGIPGTKLIAEDRNGIQTELLNIIDALGLTQSYVDLQQVKEAIGLQVAAAPYYVDSGIVNAYIIDRPADMIAPSELRAGMVFTFRPLNTNTAASTIQYPTAGSIIALKKPDGSTDIDAGDLSLLIDAKVMYNGSVFILLNTVLSNLTINNKFQANEISEVFQRIYSIFITSPTTTINIPGLDSDNDIVYKFVMNFVNSGSTTSISMQFNTDTGANYGIQNGRFSNATPSASRLTGQTSIPLLTSNANTISTVEGIITHTPNTDLKTVLFSAGDSIAGTTVNGVNKNCGVWDGVGNITSIQINSSVASQIWQPSFVEIYARRA